jgi:hypothetical protein
MQFRSTHFLVHCSYCSSSPLLLWCSTALMDCVFLQSNPHLDKAHLDVIIPQQIVLIHLPSYTPRFYCILPSSSSSWSCSTLLEVLGCIC